MPYKNMPKGASTQGKMEDCVKAVMKKGNSKMSDETQEQVPLDAIRYQVFVDFVKGNSDITSWEQLSWRDCVVLMREASIELLRLKSRLKLIHAGSAKE